jgi:hypothetical protein
MNSFYIQLIVHTLIGILASLVKNPNSARAQQLRGIVQEVHDATEEFLAATEPKVKP